MTDICEEKLERKCSSGLWHEGGECPSDDSDPSNPCKRKPCCSNDGSCSLDHESECDDQGGTVSDGEDCGPNPCPGACCTTDGSCSEDSQVDCLYLIDYKSWYEGGSCDPTPCPGTCCASDGGCTETKQEDCAAWGSEWSEGGSCSPNECPQPGACCVPEGMGCSMYLETDCDDVGGTFQGDGTSCDPDPCEYACCDAAASCSLATYDDCEDGGDYIEGSDTCETDTCPKGACCRIADGQCAIANEWHCEEDEDYSYDGSDSCTPNPCEQPPSGSSESSQSSEGQESTPDGGADDDTSGDDDSGDDDMPAE